jgi:protein TonB
VKPQPLAKLFQVSLLRSESPTVANESAMAPARKQSHQAVLHSSKKAQAPTAVPTRTPPSQPVLSSVERTAKAAVPPFVSAADAPAIASSEPPSTTVVASARSASAEARNEALSGPSLDAYAQTISALLAKQRSYPSLAAMRGWEGEVRLVLRIARRSGLIEVQVQHSSGYDVLDRNAMQLVQQAVPLPQPPEGLAGSEFQVSVPIQYRLRKNS